jgi:acetyl-CoA synthetase
MTEQSAALDNLLIESRTFAPSEEFAAQANASAEWYERAAGDREAFWAEQAERLHWETKW